MIYSKNQFLTLALLTTLVGCSAGVDEKKAVSGPSEEAMVVTLSGNPKTRKSGDVDNGKSIGSDLNLEACLVDSSNNKKIVNQEVTLISNGKVTTNKTDSKGCLYWTEFQDINYENENNTKTYETLIKVNDRLNTKVVFTFNSVTEDFTDCKNNKSVACEKSKSQVTPESTAKSFKKKVDTLALSRIQFSFGAITKVRRSDDKNVHYNTSFSSCIAEVKNKKRLENVELEVSIVNKENGDNYKKIISTDGNGCFAGNYPSKFAQYDYSHWMKNKYKVTVLEGALAGESITKNMLINPWEKSSNLFAKDAQFYSPAENPIKKPAQLRLDGVMYIFVGNNVANFEVDNNMGLTLSKTYQVVLNPSTDVGHRFSKDFIKYPRITYNGKFKLSFMILAPKTDQMEINVDNRHQFDYITGASKVVEINNGKINSLIDLKFKATDLPRLATRAVSVFKLEPLDPSIGLQPTIVTGFFKAKLAWIKTNVLQNEALNVDLNDKGYGVKGETQRVNEKSYQSNIISKKEEIRESYSKDNVDTSKFEKMENFKRPINLLQKKLSDNEISFNKYINKLFDKLNAPVYEKGNFQSKGVGLKVFKRHLKKNVERVEFFDDLKTLSFDKSVKITEKDLEYVLNPANRNAVMTEDMKKEVCKAGFNVNGKVEHKVLGIFTAKLPIYKECLKNPTKFFKINSFRHLSKIKETLPKFSNGMVLSLGSRFATNVGQGETVFKSVRTGIDMAVKVPFGDFLGLGLRLFDVSYGKSWNDFQNSSVGDYASTNKSASVEKFVIGVKGIYDRCVLVRGKTFKYINPEYQAYISSSMMIGMMPQKYLEDRADVQFYVCGEQKEEEFVESWYYIQSYLNSSSLLRDIHGPTEVKLMKVLRGEKVFRRMYDALVDDTKTYLFKKEVSIDTPEVRLLGKWGHLLDDEFVTKEVCEEKLDKESGDMVKNCTLDNIDEDQAMGLLKSHVEGTFPGTIE